MSVTIPPQTVVKIHHKLLIKYVTNCCEDPPQSVAKISHQLLQKYTVRCCENTSQAVAQICHKLLRKFTTNYYSNICQKLLWGSTTNTKQGNKTVFCLSTLWCVFSSNLWFDDRNRPSPRGTETMFVSDKYGNLESGTSDGCPVWILTDLCVRSPGPVSRGFDFKTFYYVCIMVGGT